MAARAVFPRAVAMLLCTYLLWVCLLLVGAAPAAAHNVLISTDPEQGATLPKPPELITLTFDDEVLAVGTVLEVTGPDGLLDLPAPQVADAVVTQQLPARLPSGDYSTAWRVTSADGHPIEGTLTFVVVPTPGSSSGPAATGPAATGPTSGAPSESPAAESSAATRGETAQDDTGVVSDTGTSPLVWSIGAVAVVLIVASAWFTARRNHSR